MEPAKIRRIVRSIQAFWVPDTRIGAGVFFAAGILGRSKSA